jgi:DNA-binding CsgD family transcriptional regulator
VGSDRLVRAAREVERACADAMSLVDLCRSVHTAISPIVPTDRWCGFAVDPATLIGTNGYHDEGVDVSYLPRLLQLEYGETDATQIPELVRSPTGVATISEATGGDPASSPRWREVIEPSGLSHELRAVFRDGKQAWGALVFFRGPDVADFGPVEQSFMQQIAPAVAAGFKGVLVRQHVGFGDDAREAGILLLGGEPLEVRTATTAARFWLEQLDDSGAGILPTAVLSAARAARSQQRVTAIRARTRSGRWLTITAEVTDEHAAAGERDVGVVVQPSRPAEIAQILAAAHGLTRRETEIVLLLACGSTNQEIARRLGLSRYTVADHLKSIFGKLDVATRGELTSKLFFDYYLPRATARPAGTDGWFLPD